jgi:hypothetical protein
MLAELASLAGNLVGGLMGQKSAEKQNAQNIAMQKEFAQNGIRWKVEDAKAAGIHPLAALGAQTMSFAPSSIGDPLPGAIAQSGQDLSRAINSTRTEGERLDAYTKSLQQLNLQKLGLENQLLASQIAKINQAGTPPSMPAAGSRYLLDGQAQSGLVATSPMARQAADPSVPSIEAGAISEGGFARTAGGWAPVPSKDLMDRQEEDHIGNFQYNIRNRLLPFIDSEYFRAPPLKLGPEKYWYFDPITGEYRIGHSGNMTGKDIPGYPVPWY